MKIELKEIKISENGDIFIKMAENEKTITLSDNGFNGIYNLFFLKKEERKKKEKSGLSMTDKPQNSAIFQMKSG